MVKRRHMKHNRKLKHAYYKLRKIPKIPEVIIYFKRGRFDRDQCSIWRRHCVWWTWGTWWGQSSTGGNRRGTGIIRKNTVLRWYSAWELDFWIAYSRLGSDVKIKVLRSCLTCLILRVAGMPPVLATLNHFICMSDHCRESITRAAAVLLIVPGARYWGGLDQTLGFCGFPEEGPCFWLES